MVIEKEVEVGITCSTPGAIIYWTDDGSVPDRFSKHYTNGQTIKVVKTGTFIKAVALAKNMADSDVVEAGAYTIKVPAPLFIPNGGAFEEMAQVDITSSVQTLKYTTSLLQLKKISCQDLNHPSFMQHLISELQDLSSEPSRCTRIQPASHHG